MQRSKPNWPSHPNKKYQNEWISWYNFLDKEDCFLNFKDLQSEVQELGIKTSRSYFKIKKSKPNWPYDPSSIYKKEWRSWKIFLKTGVPLLNYKQLKKEVLILGISSVSEYRNIKKSKPNWPADPAKYFKDKWESWNIFFEKETLSFISFESLKVQIRKLNVKNSMEYNSLQKNKPNWPSSPNATYKERWTNWYNFLGKAK